MTATEVFLTATLPLIVSMWLAVWFGSRQLEQLSRHVDERLNDLREFFKNEVKRLEDRIERIEGLLQHPVVRP